jgi:hypothetical protein
VSATRRLIGPGGPDALERDQFSSTWSAWYEAKTREWSKVLDSGWTRQTINSRRALAAHLEEKARVDFLTEKYPGPFASSVKADWERVRDSLVGRAYTIMDRDLAYRRLGAERASKVAAAASRARESFLAAVKRETIDAFPAIDPIHGIWSWHVLRMWGLTGHLRARGSSKGKSRASIAAKTIATDPKFPLSIAANFRNPALFDQFMRRRPELWRAARLAARRLRRGRASRVPASRALRSRSAIIRVASATRAG